MLTVESVLLEQDADKENIASNKPVKEKTDKDAAVPGSQQDEIIKEKGVFESSDSENERPVLDVTDILHSDPLVASKSRPVLSDSDPDESLNSGKRRDISAKVLDSESETEDFQKKKKSLDSESESEILNKKKKSLDSESEQENVKKISIDSGSKPDNFRKKKKTKKKKFLDSEDGNDSSSTGSDKNSRQKESDEDSEMPIVKKKKKKLTKKREKATTKREKGSDLGDLTDDEDDELLEDLETWLKKNEIVEDKTVDQETLQRSTDNDSDGSDIGMPVDTFVIKKADDRDTVHAKKKKFKEYNPDWERTEKGPGGGGDEEEKKMMKEKKTKKGELDPVAQLVSERQRMFRETEIRLPRHEPAPLQLTDCLARIPKLTALKPNIPVEKMEDVKFVPKLSAKTDDFFLPKNLGNFMNRFKKHLSFSAKLSSDVEKTPCTAARHSQIPAGLAMKKQLQSQLKDAILAKKREARRAAQLERMIDEERFGEDEVEKMLDNQEEEEMSSEEEAVVMEVKEDVDEKVDRRAEKILQGEEVTSSEEEERERNYHSNTDSDLLASADEVHVRELSSDSASEDDALQPSRYSLRRLTRYVRKKRIVRSRATEKTDAGEGASDEESREKIAKARKKIESLLVKRKEMKKRKEEQREKKRKIEEERRRMEEIARKAEAAALLSEKQKREEPVAKATIKPAAHKPWLSDSDSDDLPEFNTDHVSDHVTAGDDVTGEELTAGRVTSAQPTAVHRYTDEVLEARAARILAGEELSSSESEPDRKYHSDTDSDLLASADEVHVRELSSDSASEDDALQPSRYSLRRLTRYCRKKRLKRRKRKEERVSIGSESEKEEKAKKKLQALLDRREKIRRKISAKKRVEPDNTNSYSSTGDLFSRHSRSTLDAPICSTLDAPICSTLDAKDRELCSTLGFPISSTIIPDSLDTLPVSEKTFDVDTAVRNMVADSPPVLRRNPSDFLAPDEDAVFLDTQGMLRSDRDESVGAGGIEGLGGSQLFNSSSDMLNLCSGQFPSTAPEESEGRVTLHTHNISFNMDEPKTPRPGATQTPRQGHGATQTPISKPRHGMSQTPLTSFGKLLQEGLLSQESDEEEEEVVRKKGKRRALYSDMMDGEAEKSGSDHSSDEEEGAEDEYDESMLAKDSELPSDEEELANELQLAYHDQQALEEKNQIKKLKERFIQENTGFFRTRKFHGEDSNMDLFSPNLGLDPDDEDEAAMSVEEYKAAMEKRTERLKKDQFVKEKQKREVLSGMDEDSQAFLDSLQDITDSTSRSAFSSSQQCGSFLKHGSGTLHRLSSITSSSLHSDTTSNKGYIFQTVSPAQNKRKSSSQFSASSKRPKRSSDGKASVSDEKKKKSIFNVI